MAKLDVKTRVENLRKEFPEIERKKLVAFLTIEDYTAKEIAEAIPAEKRKAFREDYYDYLVENIPTQEEAEAWIKGYDGLTENQEKHLKDFLRDAALVRRVAEKVVAE